MRRLEVWAPNAAEVALWVDEQAVPMRPRGDGTFVSERAYPAKTRYGFLVDGAGPFPDPRSMAQPDGIDGLSELIDVEAFVWHDHGFRAPPLGGAVIYELHVGTFTSVGTFDAAIERLDALVELGVTHVELMPVATFSGDVGWGYDGVHLYAPHPAYGGPLGLQRLVDACHGRGLAVLLDVVYNHWGPAGNYLPEFGPYLTDGMTPWGNQPNVMGRHCNGVRRYFIDNAVMWLRDFHFDGLRLDAVDAIVDTSALHLLEALQREVTALEHHLGRPLVLIAESAANDPRLVQAQQRGGYGLAAHWNEDVHHALHVALTGERQGYYVDYCGWSDLAKALERAYVLDGTYSIYYERDHGRPADGVGGECFVVYAQNHDQVGNRAKGERLTQLVSMKKAMIAMAVVMCSPFVPMIFQGEEWGSRRPFYYFTRHADPALGEAVSRGRTRELTAFGWDPARIVAPQSPRAFEASRIDWGEATRPDHGDMLRWVKSLINLRRSHPDLGVGPLRSAGGVEAKGDDVAQTLFMRRGSVALALNASDEGVVLSLPASGDAILLASSIEATLQGPSIVLPPESVAIVQLAAPQNPRERARA